MGVIENDFIMRQIEDMTGMLGKVFLHKQQAEEIHEEDLNDEEAKNYLRKIKKLMEEGNFKEAAAALKNDFKNGNMEYLSVALTCFDQMNAKDETELSNAGYSRNQLYNDLSFISEQFGICL